MNGPLLDEQGIRNSRGPSGVLSGTSRSLRSPPVKPSCQTAAYLLRWHCTEHGARLGRSRLCGLYAEAARPGAKLVETVDESATGSVYSFLGDNHRLPRALPRAAAQPACLRPWRPTLVAEINPRGREGIINPRSRRIQSSTPGIDDPLTPSGVHFSSKHSLQ